MPKIIEKNKKAYFDYFIEETFEAGVVLEGAEVKSVKAGNVSLKDSFCQIDGGEVWLKNCHITPYDKGSSFNPEPRRNRKLLLNKSQINKLIGKIKQKGYALVPTQIYMTGRFVKLEIALAKGKQLHDKRDSIREKDLKRDTDREIKNYK
ncbi:MAG: SsrA-binding protein SmpB [Clostridiales bacterium]|jgi:SsrA-binding protein|nr:SsrA-binding protein SmpB [Clostridiales bacterium]